MIRPTVEQANKQNFDKKIFGEFKKFGGSDVANKLFVTNLYDDYSQLNLRYIL